MNAQVSQNGVEEDEDVTEMVEWKFYLVLCRSIAFESKKVLHFCNQTAFISSIIVQVVRYMSFCWDFHSRNLISLYLKLAFKADTKQSLSYDSRPSSI